MKNDILDYLSTEGPPHKDLLNKTFTKLHDKVPQTIHNMQPNLATIHNPQKGQSSIANSLNKTHTGIVLKHDQSRNRRNLTSVSIKTDYLSTAADTTMYNQPFNIMKASNHARQKSSNSSSTYQIQVEPKNSESFKSQERQLFQTLVSNKNSYQQKRKQLIQDKIKQFNQQLLFEKSEEPQNISIQGWRQKYTAQTELGHLEEEKNKETEQSEIIEPILNYQKYRSISVAGGDTKALILDYDKSAKYMKDYRSSLLCTMVNQKLGLEKRVQKKDSIANDIIHEIRKKINPARFKPKERALTQPRSTAISGRLNLDQQHQKHLSFTKDAQINTALNKIYNMNSIDKDQDSDEGSSTKSFDFDKSLDKRTIQQMLEEYDRLVPDTSKNLPKSQFLSQRSKSKLAKKDEREKKRVSAVTQLALFTETDEKAKGTKLEQFVKKYNYYITKVLWSRADDYLQYKRKIYQTQFEKSSLNKYANVFNRLKFDQEQRLMMDGEKTKRHKELYRQLTMSSPSSFRKSVLKSMKQNMSKMISEETDSPYFQFRMRKDTSSRQILVQEGEVSCQKLSFLLSKSPFKNDESPLDFDSKLKSYEKSKFRKQASP